MLRVTIDTNVYVSGLNYKGNPFRVLELARARKIIAAVSDPILAEVERILRQRFAWPESRALQAREEIRDFCVRVAPRGRLRIIQEDPDDDRILECAVASRCNYIISGDKDLLRLGRLGPIRIVNPAVFLSIPLDKLTQG